MGCALNVVLAGESGAKLVPRRIRACRHGLGDEGLLSLGDESLRATAMRRGLHRAGLSCKAQDAVDGGAR